MSFLRALVMVSAAISIACAQSHPDAGGNSGGRDVTVALFSTHEVREVMLSPLGATAWIADCTTCAHRALTVPMRYSGPRELFVGGSLRVVDVASGEERRAAGLWRFRGVSGALDIVLTLPSERYVAAVLAAESDAHEPAESLRAMAIVARTYALKDPHYAASAGHLKADLCDSTECQAAHFGAVSTAIDQAVWDTAGETLWFGAKRAEVYFSQSCGGVTEDASVAWPYSHASYLGVHADPYCARRNASWHTEVPLGDLASIAATQHWRLPAEVVSGKVTKRSSAHRALLLQFTGRGGEIAAVSAASLRLAIGRALGWNRIRSDWYEVGVRNGLLVFDGRGFGHGVGLCQFGAAEMAAEHKTAAEILAFYFPGTHISIGAADTGWTSERVEGVMVRSTGALTSDRKRVIQAAWTQAQHLLPPRTSVTPELIFTPSVELFRQMTAQPGWMLASTSAAGMVLQPQSVLGSQEANTLLHEMLHVLIETEATTKAPLWFREGLAEALSGEAGGAVMSAAAMDNELAHPTTRTENQRAHHAAAAKVQAMTSHYGLAQVRGWLISGVPANIS